MAVVGKAEAVVMAEAVDGKTVPGENEWTMKPAAEEHYSQRDECPCEPFLRQQGLRLGDFGFTADPGRIEHGQGTVAFYHYTREEHLRSILAADGGLWARLSVPTGTDFPEFADHFLVEGFLVPSPTWVTASPYFGDLAHEMMQQYVGDVLLRVEVPDNFSGLYVADYAHILECKHEQRRGRSALGLGYDCRTGHEVTRAFVNSYIPLMSYLGGHLAPNVQCVRDGEGIAVPSQYITVYPMA